MSTFTVCLPTVLRDEGVDITAFYKSLKDGSTLTLKQQGFVDNPKDPGGATDYGISLKYLKSIGHVLKSGKIEVDFSDGTHIDITDIRDLTPQDVVDVYRGMWENGHYTLMNNNQLSAKVFSTCVNVGQSPGTIFLQKALNRLGEKLVVDGGLGPNTAQAANSHAPNDILEQYVEQQAQFYRDLVAKNDDLSTFLKGWLNRANSTELVTA